MINRRRASVVLVVAAALAFSSVASGQTLSTLHATVVSADPSDLTPHALDGKVTAILPLGNRVYVGGSFTQVREDSDIVGTAQTYARQGLFSFDPATGKVDPAFVANFDISPDPNVGRAVEALAADPSGNALFVGGDFGTLNGATMRKLAKISAISGNPAPLFNVSVSSSVKDLAVVGDQLIVAGAFNQLNGQARNGLGAVDIDTGALDSSPNLSFTQPRQGAVPRVETIAVTPDGKTLVAGGNFSLVDGQSRYQVAVLDIGSNPAKLTSWQTDRFDDRRTPDDPKYATDPFKCATKFDAHPRDIDFAPDGSYFVIVTTGAYSSTTLCDTATRWETSARGSGQQPTWVDYDGGDSFTGVAVTGAAVYVGGHNRWLNNPFPNGSSVDGAPGEGFVAREGIAALDPKSGLPLPWNPGRERGEGAWAIVATADGLWVGGDTDHIGGQTGTECLNCEFHQKLAFFPLVGGSPIAAFADHGLPGDLYTMGSTGIARRYFDGRLLGSALVLPSSLDWDRMRGSFAVGNRLYTGMDDGRLLAWSFDGAHLGQPEAVNLRGLTPSQFPVSKITGMFYDAGHLYYTREGDKKLYYRYFLSETSVADDVVGAQTLVASGETDGLDWSQVAGMTEAGGRIYWSEGADLRRIDFADGKPKSSTAAVAVGGAGLNSRGFFLMPQTTTAPTEPIDPPGPIDPPPPPPPAPPVPSRSGYWMVASDGRVYAFGQAAHLGDAAALLGSAEAVDLEPTPSFNGYWVVDETGRVFGFGDAAHFGNVDTSRLARGEKVTSISATRTGAGYWIFTTRGRALAFGDARHFGDMAAVTLNGPVLDSIPTPSGQGYYMVASDGGIFAFGDAKFYGSMGGKRLNAPVQSLVPDPDGTGYWLVASDGGVFAFEGAFRGSMGDKKLNKPVTGMVPFGNGYLMVATDGGIFNFSDRQFFGSLGDHPPARPVVSVAVLD